MGSHLALRSSTLGDVEGSTELEPPRCAVVGAPSLEYVSAP
jgi:hypothetical protein